MHVGRADLGPQGTAKVVVSGGFCGPCLIPQSFVQLCWLIPSPYLVTGLVPFPSNVDNIIIDLVAVARHCAGQGCEVHMAWVVIEALECVAVVEAALIKHVHDEDILLLLTVREAVVSFAEPDIMLGDAAPEAFELPIGD